MLHYIGYVRGYTQKEIISQSESLMLLNGIENIFSEIIREDNWSYRNNRIKDIPKGYVLVVVSITYISKNINELFEFIDILDEKGIKFMALNEGIETVTAMGRGMIDLIRGASGIIYLLNKKGITVPKTKALQQLKNGLEMIEKKYMDAYKKRSQSKFSGAETLGISLGDFETVEYQWRTT